MPRKKKEEEPKLFKCTKEENYSPDILKRLQEENITDISQVDPSSIDWYDMEKMFKKYRSSYYMCIGQRGDGKSYSSLKICLKNFRDNGKKFVYMRRWTDDVNTFACSTLIKQELVDEIFGLEYEVKFRNHVFTLVHTYEDESGKLNTEKWDIGYAVAISESKHRKGTNFPDTNLIFFDEFIDMAGENLLANEFNKFENIVNTIKRQNNVKILMCANTVSKYSEYFTKLGINADLIEQGETKEYLSSIGFTNAVLEYCRNNYLIGYFVGALTQSQMIATGQWEIPETDEIPSCENEKVEEKLLFTALQPDIDATIGMYLRHGIWQTYETNDLGLVQPIDHEREFLVIRRMPNDSKSSYYHLTNQKSLSQTHYHKLDNMLRDIEEEVGIDVKRELEMGRIFCDNMFTGDIFTQIWQYYGIVKVRTLL